MASKLPKPGSHVTALSIQTLAWSGDAAPLRATRISRVRIEKIAMDWQHVSFRGDWSESVTASRYPGPQATLKLDRVNELAGLMGSTGEQLCLARTAEQDAQRWHQGGRGLRRAQQRMAIRALSEMSAYFSLGAANSLANIILRVLILDERWIDEKNGRFACFHPNRYKPGSAGRKEWPSFPGDLVSALERAARLVNSDRCIGNGDANTASRRCERLVNVLTWLESDPRFAALVERRGMDYHRHRPQSLSNRSPRGGVWTVGPGFRSIGVGSVRPDPDHDEKEVQRIAAGGLEVVATAMNRARPLIVSAAASLGYLLVA